MGQLLPTAQGENNHHLAHLSQNLQLVVRDIFFVVFFLGFFCFALKLLIHILLHSYNSHNACLSLKQTVNYFLKT